MDSSKLYFCFPSEHIYPFEKGTNKIIKFGPEVSKEEIIKSLEFWINEKEKLLKSLDKLIENKKFQESAPEVIVRKKLEQKKETIEKLAALEEAMEKYSVL